MKTKTTGFLTLAWAAFFSLAPAWAQTHDAAPPGAATPPRLAFSQGDVQFWRPSSAGWEPAQINIALAEGDTIDAGGDAAVELQVGPSGFARLAADTQLTLENNTRGALQFRLAKGDATFDLRGANAGLSVRIDTRAANLVVAAPGYYRLQVTPNETRLTVRANGRAAMTSADGRNHDVAAGTEIRIGNDGARVENRAAPAPDAWDEWNDARFQYYRASSSNNYVPPDVYGAADLDGYGNWSDSGTYGAVWIPAVAADWSPYSQGYWSSDPYYGWTWVDAYPWGWTTSHYGRWVRIGNVWGWAPGPRVAGAVYAPALVAFFDGGGGMSWVALGWGEPLLPWWGGTGFRGTAWWGGWHGPRVTYRQQSYTYRNSGIDRAVISVRASDFGHRPVRGSNFAIPIKDRRPVQGNLPVRGAPAQPMRRDAMPPRPEFRQGTTRDNAARPVPGNRPQPGATASPPNGPQRTAPPDRFAPQARPAPQPGNEPGNRQRAAPRTEIPQPQPAPAPGAARDNDVPVPQNRPAPSPRPSMSPPAERGERGRDNPRRETPRTEMPQPAAPAQEATRGNGTPAPQNRSAPFPRPVAAPEERGERGGENPPREAPRTEAPRSQGQPERRPRDDR